MRGKPLCSFLLLITAMVAAGFSLPGQITTPQAPPSESLDPQAAVSQRIEGYLRDLFAWGPETEVSIGPLRESPIPGLYSVLVRVSEGQRRVDDVLLVSPDGRYLIRGDFFDTTQDPFAEARESIVTAGHPSRGPADAPVTIVEYGDFQCSTCAEMHPILKKILAEHRDVRLVFKDFPLTGIHNWALAAAIAAQCAYQQSNQSFWRLHDYFLENQKQLTAANLQARLDAFAPQAGLNSQQFRACRTQERPRARVEQSMREGTALRVINTPTLFINGRPAIGSQPRELLERLITYELRSPQQGTRLR